MWCNSDQRKAIKNNNKNNFISYIRNKMKTKTYLVFLYIIVNKFSQEIISKHMASNKNKGEMRQIMNLLFYKETLLGIAAEISGKKK